MNKRSFNKDDHKEQYNFHEILFVIKYLDELKKEWESVSINICLSDFSVVAKHKPIMDKEKEKIMLLKCNVEKFYLCGTSISMKKYDRKMIEGFSTRFNEDTISSDWNNISKKINNTLNKLVNKLWLIYDLKKLRKKQKNIIIDIYSDHQNDQQKDESSKYRIIFVLCMIIICGSFVALYV